MDTETEVRCPFLPVAHFHDNLVVSSLSNAVGSVVEFICSGDDDILSGPSVLQCSASGRWNGSVPTCIDENATHTPTISVSEADGSSTFTPEESPAEVKVETVLIVLWVTGGLLLVTLVILMTCILTTHKKRQRDRGQRCSPRGQGNPRHGGVNPTFSNYDEIWTWIPVVNGNNDNCRNQNSTSTRESSATQTNRELMRNLRLPSYNEAIRESQTGSRHVSQLQIVPQRQNVIQSQTVPNSNVRGQSHVQINTRPNVTRSTHVQRNLTGCRENRSQMQNESIPPTYHIRVDTHTSTNMSDQHHYETIPADINRVSHNRNNPENTANATRVTAPSALQQARDLVNQSSAPANRPQPSALELSHVQSRSRAVSAGMTSNDSNWRLVACTNPSQNEHRRGTQDSLAQVHRSIQNHQRSSYDFRHSEASVFEYYGEGNRRPRPHIPSATTTREDQHPPYSISREPPYQSRGQTSGFAASRSSATAGAVSIHTGFESQYF